MAGPAGRQPGGGSAAPGDRGPGTPPPGVTAPAVQHLLVRYAKCGKMRFASHRDAGRAFERAVRKAGLPIAHSGGFTPHPKISYAGGAPTGVASEAEYLSLALTSPWDPGPVRDRLNAALPDGIGVIEVTEYSGGTLADRLTASEWRVVLPGVTPEAVGAAARAFLAAGRAPVERLTNKGMRRLDARAAVVTMELDQRPHDAYPYEGGVLRIVVRHTEPAVRPEDILTALRQVAGVEPASPAKVTRLAQGMLDDDGVLSDKSMASGVSLAGKGTPAGGRSVPGGNVAGGESVAAGDGAVTVAEHAGFAGFAPLERP